MSDYIDVRVKFDKEVEDEGTPYEYVYYSPQAVFLLDSSIPEDYIDGIGETAAQSDFYQIDVSNAFLGALGGEDTYFERRY